MSAVSGRPAQEPLAEPFDVPDLPCLATLTVAGRPVARYVDGADLPRQLAPRPFLHPVRTAAGTPVSAAFPADHRWHLGVGVAVQDVAGYNLWGGRTYVRGTGYEWRADHGSMRHVELAGAGPAGFTARLDWHAPDGAQIVHETRTVLATALPDGDWALDLVLTLTTATAGRPVDLGSPATNGRAGGGYGGFFWRLPPLQDAEVRTPHAAGEQAVHGSRAAWLAVSGRVHGRPVVLVATQPAAPDDAVRRGARPDPWFVRLAGYPGFGASLAAQRPVTVPPDGSLTRHVRVAVADGTPDPAALAAQLAALPDGSGPR